MALNHYAINQIINGKMVAGPDPRFGGFGLLNTVGEILKHRPRPPAKVSFDYDSDRIIYDAFIKVYDGHSPETVAMMDHSLASKFHATARKLGFHASAADMNRRLLNIRKNKARYEPRGMVIPEATKTIARPSIVPEYAHIIEFSLSRMRSRFGVSIDDILIDPELTNRYEEMARSAAPQLTSLQLRLAALYIRKTRYIQKDVKEIVKSLNTKCIESEFTDVGTLREFKSTLLSAEAGLIEILENGRHLYVSKTENLRAAVEQIGSPLTLNFMANDFWRPKAENLVLRVLAGDTFRKVNIGQWQLKLIQEKRPGFNWPIAA